MERMDDQHQDFEHAEADHSDEAGAAMIDPRKMSRKKLAGLGFVKRPIMSVIRAKCLDCCCGSSHEVMHCTTAGCPLWPYRTGKNPFTDRKANPAAIAALKEAREAKKRAGELDQ
jgi:hypothetical protein